QCSEINSHKSGTPYIYHESFQKQALLRQDFNFFELGSGWFLIQQVFRKSLARFRKRPTYMPSSFCYVPINMVSILSYIEVFTIERQSHASRRFA
ncbi:hypothetical protein, partial [Pseudomonas syringae]